MTTQTATLTSQKTAGHLRKMNLGEFDRFTTLIETAFAEDQAREGRSFRDEVRDLNKLLPLFRVMFAVMPGLENYFYTLVWDVDGRFASAATISRQGSDVQRWTIANVATHPDFRGRGLARTLVNAALERIRAQGGRYALLDVRADNEPAYRLYRSLGFLHLETSTTLKGDARPTPRWGVGQGVADHYALRPIAITDWRTRFAIAQRLASPETRSVCPPTAKQFQDSRIGRGLQTLINRAQHVKSQAWAVEAADQPIGLVTCRARGGGSNPHRVQIEIAPDHLIAAPAVIAQAINFCVEQRSGAVHPMLIDLAGQPQDLINYLRDNGFTPIETLHELGMNVL
jgi:ribosomal protein S18 acetylase RimI-like enzyme